MADMEFPHGRVFVPSMLEDDVLRLLAPDDVVDGGQNWLMTLVCDFQQQADAKFGDQHFKTAIALIELHKARNGQYPESLKALQFTGDWDALLAVKDADTVMVFGHDPAQWGERPVLPLSRA